MANRSYTYKELEALTGNTMQEMYERRMYGFAPWSAMAFNGVCESTIAKAVEKWAKENGLKFEKLSSSRMASAQPTDDPRGVDQGKCIALYKGRWKLKDIAFECFCTENAARQIIKKYLEGVNK